MGSFVKHWYKFVEVHTIGQAINYFGRRIEKKKFTDIPIIIGGCPRSGSTLLLSILGACDRIFPVPNQTAAFYYWKKDPPKGTGKEKYFPVRIDRLYREFLYNRIPDTATRWLEKTPRHIQYFGRILEYYGNRILLINIVRDGRDVITSKHPKHRPKDYYLDISRWINDIEIGLTFKDHKQVLTVRYEDIIHDFNRAMSMIYSFIGEDIPVTMNEWWVHTTIKQSKHWDKPVQDIYSHTIMRWKRPEHKKRIREFMNNPQAVRLLKELGYEL